MRGFRDEVAVVTGAGSGIGRALTLDLARAGARVEVSDIVGEAAEETATRARELGGWAKAVTLDVADREAMRAYARDIEDEHGRVDLVCNNAGMALAAQVVEQSIEDVYDVLDVNLRGVINGTQAFLPALQRAHAGRLVNISSLFGLVAMPYNSAYAASKFGVRGYTEALAIELDIAGSPVTVHCVHPGGIDTGIIDNGIIHPGNEDAAEQGKRVLRMPPEKAARIILRGVARGKRRIIVGADARIVHAAQLCLGSSFNRVIGAGGRAARQLDGGRRLP
jgi:NAD(P)-dependent dehydrogenase (short-subunit alcohol dehydrogenase family)